MSDNPLSGEVKLDVTNYKAGITELNRQIRVIETGFRASAAALGQWDKSAEGLEMRNKALTSSMDLQQKKVDALQEVFDELASSGKASNKELAELQIKINKETETLGKMQSELKQTSSTLDQMGDESKQTGTQVKELGEKEDQTREKSEKLKSSMSKLWGVMKTGTAIVAGVAGAVGGMLAGVGKMITSSAAAADEIVELSAKTGFSTQELQEMGYIAEQTGTSMETMTKANAKLIQSIGDAGVITSDQAKAFDKLGISLYDADGQLRDSQTIFYEAIDALGKVENETDRGIISNDLFGRSFQELNPLIKEGSEGLNEMRKEANENGIVMSGEATQGLADFNDMLAGLKLGLKGVMGELSFALLPGLSGFGDKAKEYLGWIKDTVVMAREGGVGMLASSVGNVIGRILADLATQGPKLMQGGLSILKGLLSAIINNLPIILPAVIEMVMAIVDFLIESLPLLLTAAVQIILMLAQGLTQALPTLIPTILGIIPMVVQLLIDNLPLLLMAALEMILALANGLVDALPALIESIPTLVMALVNAIIDNLPSLLIAAVEIILALAFGLIENVPLLLAMVPQIITELVNKFKSPEFKEQLKTIGKDLIDGLKQGWTDAWANFVESVTENWDKLLLKVKELLGIASPSKVFAEIGQNMALGLGAGFKGEMERVQRGMNSLARGGFGLSPIGAGIGGNSYSDMYSFYAPVVIQGEAGQSLGQSLKAKRY